ncbi:hypothetical protein JUN65_02150 [Gluconacetobacter azotocaptans]|uniref:hypothetical protein n=1 Tax=Gluconacetobacter azotocaptans TaxID=142834 RepID=UPI00195AFE50|nr:hypothetical protein [Gluconacetobacter azotocaptans]MBM9400396.1 hypothetical protein [Gluconacetobacter azotocaptans]
MTSLLDLWTAYSGPIGALGAAGTGLMGWYGQMVRARMSSRRDHLEAGRQALDLVARAAERETKLDALVTSYMDRADAAQRQRIEDMSHVQDVYAAAIAARLMVYELDAAAGRPPRDFPPLPPYPIPADQEAAPDGAPTAGATDVDAAELRADSTHG